MVIIIIVIDIVIIICERKITQKRGHHFLDLGHGRQRRYIW